MNKLLDAGLNFLACAFFLAAIFASWVSFDPEAKPYAAHSKVLLPALATPRVAKTPRDAGFYPQPGEIGKLLARLEAETRR